VCTCVYGCLVHVGETFNRFADFGLYTKMRLAAGLRPDPLGSSAIALPGPPNRYKGRGGREREEKGRKYEGRKGSEGKDVKG